MTIPESATHSIDGVYYRQHNLRWEVYVPYLESLTKSNAWFPVSLTTQQIESLKKITDEAEQ